MPAESRTRALLTEALSLKNIPRTGWLLCGAPRESVAEHVYGTATIALVLARMEKLKPQDEAALVRCALLHDLHEARIGDLVPSQKRKRKPNEAEAEREMLKGTLLEPEIALLCGKRASARVLLLAADADRLDMLLRALENSRGSAAARARMQAFIGSALRGIKSKSGRKLARLALQL